MTAREIAERIVARDACTVYGGDVLARAYLELLAGQARGRAALKIAKGIQLDADRILGR